MHPASSREAATRLSAMAFDFVDIDAVFESVEHVEAYRAYYFRFCGFNSVARGIVAA